jgi:hypothetical protein
MREPNEGKVSSAREDGTDLVNRATGPRTLSGKERSKYNALRHGIFSKAVVLKTESREEYDSLVNGLRVGLQPVGTLEEIFVENLAMLIWRRRRFIIAETGEIRKNTEHLEMLRDVGPHLPDMDSFVRYEAHLSREFDRTLNQLERAQRLRLGQPLLAPIKVDLSTR